MSDLPAKDRRARFLVKAGVLEYEAESLSVDLALLL